MTKRDLIVEVATRLGYTQNEVAGIVHGMLGTITQTLAKGERLEIRNFGVFEVKTRDARMGRNPRTGEEVPIEQKRVPTFKPGKALKEHVQDGYGGRPPAQPKGRDSSADPTGAGVSASEPAAVESETPAESGTPAAPGEQQSLF